jgi:excinuclease ABC subunit C
MVASALDEVPGLGDVRRKALLKHFGSLKRLRAATAEEVQEVPGIGPTTAAVIVATLHRPSDQATSLPPVNVATGEILDDEPLPMKEPR